MATVGKSLRDWGGEGGVGRELRRRQVVAEEPWLDRLKAETGQFNERRLSPALILHFENGGEGAMGKGSWNKCERWPTG